MKGVPLLETELEWVVEQLELFLKKAKWSEFNSLHTGCKCLDLWPRMKAGMTETCARVCTLESCR